MEPAAESNAEEKMPKPKRNWLMGCAMTVLIVGCALALGGAFWARHVDRERDRLADHVRALIDEYEAFRTVVPDEDNAAPLYLSSFAAFVRTKYYGSIETSLANDPGSPRSDFTGPGAIALLAANQAYLKTLEQAAARPGCDFRLDLSKGFCINLRHRDGFRQAARFLAIAARHESQSNRPDQALERLTLGLHVIRSLDSDGVLVSCMDRRAHAGLIYSTLKKVLDESDPSSAALTQTLAVITEERHRDEARPNAKLIQAEKVMAAADVLRLVDKTNLVSNGAWGGEYDCLDGSPKTSRIGAILWRAGLFARDERMVEDHLDEMMAICTKPFPLVLDEAETVGERWARAPLPSWAILSRAYLRSWDRLLVISSAAPLARNDLARLGLGCRLYRLKSGAYPESLAALSAKLPEHFKELPADPFTGKPFLYKRTATGCLVWSVGSDRADDGGDPQKDVVFELKK